MLSDGACQTSWSSLANERQSTRKPRHRGHCSHRLDVCQQLSALRLATYVLPGYPFSVVFSVVWSVMKFRGWLEMAGGEARQQPRT